MGKQSVDGSGWLLLCRPGFEAECAGEAVGAWRTCSGVDPRVQQGVGWVRLQLPATPIDSVPTSFRDLVFARQGSWLVMGVEEQSLTEASKLFDLLPHWLEILPRVTELLVEAPDGDAGRQLWPASGALQRRLVGAVARGRRDGPGDLRLHLTLLPPDRISVGVAPLTASSPMAGGIPRLRQSREAPSRSALKLEEALLFFLGDRGPRLMRPGMAAVDLGAAPGGWSWVLARRGLRVVAVDNGPLGRTALDTGLVDPLRADGFTYRPARPVDWLVCDMVAPPARVSKLVGLWARQGLCRKAVFNLKLPSGDRLAEWRRCDGIVRREVAAGELRCDLRFKQLYHDREELTGYLSVDQTGGKARPSTDAPPGRGSRRGRRSRQNAGGTRRGSRTRGPRS